MKQLIFLLLIITFGIATQAQQYASSKKNTTQTEFILPIPDYGKVFHVPFAKDRPDPSTQYKIIFEASVEPFDSSMVYPPLEHLARMYNLHVYGGVPQKNLDVVLAIGSYAIPVTMQNEAYRKRYGIDNPNIKILEQLKAAGIKLNGCAQSTLKYGIDPNDVNPDFTIIFSRFTTVSSYQLKGYAYFKF